MGDTIPQNTPQKQCTVCGDTFPCTLDYFHARKRNLDGLETICKRCANEKRWRDHPEIKPQEKCEKGFKRCSECQEIKPATLECFPVSSHGGYGLMHVCRLCVKVYMARLNQERAKKRTNAIQVCTTCNQALPATPEYFYREDVDLRTQCKTCKERASKEYKKAHPKEDRARYSRYRLAHLGQYAAHARTRRARVKAVEGNHTPEQIEALYKRQKGKCYYCNQPVKWGKHHVEHTYPLARVVGTDIPANDINYLVISCAVCNRGKHDKFPWEWPEGGRLL